VTDGTRLEPLLDLDDGGRAALARELEAAQAVLDAVRYGSRARVGVADVVLNPDSPLASGARATGLDGAPAAVEATLRLLPDVFAEAGLRRVLVCASPAGAPELPLLAEELGYDAVEERTALLLTRPHLLVEGEPGRSTVPLPEDLEQDVPALLAEAHGWSRGVERRLHRLMGHRFDDPRHVAVAAVERAPDGGRELVGVATGFLSGEVGQVVDVAVRPGRRRRGAGSALASGAAAELLARGATTVWACTEAGSRTERLAAGLGLEPAYDAVTYVLHLT
jgi:GNAT superfamily N-acetyltransferase